jgi:putative ATP-dependent endonuclease of OLD family
MYLIGENGCGKSSLLKAIGLAVGADRAISSRDFADIAQAIEITITLQDLLDPEKAALREHLVYGNDVTVTLQFRATWDVAAESVEIEHLGKNARRTKPDERAAIRLVTVPATREPERFLSFGSRQSLIRDVLKHANVDAELTAAATTMETANQQITSAPTVASLLDEVRIDMQSIRPPLSTSEALSLVYAAETSTELLEHFDIEFGDAANQLPVRLQCNGSAQMLLFAFLFQVVKKSPGTILALDEPEVSLHPQAQRALMRLLGKAQCQVILATHSSNLLERSDPRRITRLWRTQNGAALACPSQLGDQEAAKLARFTDSQTAEAFFARTVVLVEGASDRIALQALAERRGRNLDSLGVSIVALDGADTVATYLLLLGPRGLNLKDPWTL